MHPDLPAKDSENGRMKYYLFSKFYNKFQKCRLFETKMNNQLNTFTGSAETRCLIYLLDTLLDRTMVIWVSWVEQCIGITVKDLPGYQLKNGSASFHYLLIASKVFLVSKMLLNLLNQADLVFISSGHLNAHFRSVQSHHRKFCCFLLDH